MVYVAMQAAAQHLQALLVHPALAFPGRPALEAVMAHAPPDAHATTAVCPLPEMPLVTAVRLHSTEGCAGCWTQGLAHLAGLLRLEAYREAVLEGLVASIGGLDGVLGRAASTALLQQLHGALEAPSCHPFTARTFTHY